MKTSLLAIALATGTLAVSSLSARPQGMPPRPNPEDIVIEMFTEYDADENNSLNQAELVAAFEGLRAKHQADRQGERPRMERKAPQGDNQAARSNQGKRRGPPPPAEHAERLVQDFDTNGDSELNTEELLTALTAMHDGPRPGRPGRQGPPPAETAE